MSYVWFIWQIQAKRREVATLQEELEIANLDPKEAHARFVARVNDFKQVCHCSSYILMDYRARNRWKSEFIKAKRK